MRALRPGLLAVIGLLGVAVVAAAVLALRPTSSGSASSATAACERLVRAELKAPTTARFSGERATADTEDRWDVAGLVDSQNGFGALIRSPFSCRLQHSTAGYDRLRPISVG